MGSYRDVVVSLSLSLSAIKRRRHQTQEKMENMLRIFAVLWCGMHRMINVTTTIANDRERWSTIKTES